MPFLNQFFIKSRAVSEGDAGEVVETARGGEFFGTMNRAGRYALLSQKSLRLLLLLGGMGFLLVILLSLFHRDDRLASLVSDQESQRTALLRAQMADMHAELAKLSASTQGDEAVQPALTKLDGELTDVEQNLNSVAKSAELQQLATDMHSELDAIKNSVASGGMGKDYVDAKELPFTVQSVDVIAGQPVVTVSYDHRVLPLGVGDSLAGWKLVSADYDATVVEFVNNAGKYSQVTAMGSL